MAFTHIRGSVNFVNPGTTVTTTLAANPSLGNLVCIGLSDGSGSSTNPTVQDGNGNVYTVTPGSPVTIGTNRTWVGYLLSAPANADKAIIASWTNSAIVDLFVDEFAGGPFVFDTEAKSTGTGTAINTPSITPSRANELLYAVATCTSAMVSPANDAPQGVWTGCGGGFVGGHNAEYDLSASAAQAVDFTQTSASAWAAMAMAFTIIPDTIDDSVGTEYHWLGGEVY